MIDSAKARLLLHPDEWQLWRISPDEQAAALHYELAREAILQSGRGKMETRFGLIADDEPAWLSRDGTERAFVCGLFYRRQNSGEGGGGGCGVLPEKGLLNCGGDRKSRTKTHVV
jgi:hypothetical protein